MIFVAIAMILTNSLGKRTAGVFTGTKTNISFFNDDGDTALTAGLKNYLAESANIVDIKDDTDSIEDALFFEDRSDETIMDDQFARLLTFPNVLITGHQGFFTVEALTNIAATTIANLDSFEQNGKPLHPVIVDLPAAKPTVQAILAK
jgi:D-lactate dehydrogenase